MLVYDPRRRVTAAEALTHHYVTCYHNPTAEIEAEAKFDWTFDEYELSIGTWRTMM